MNNINSDFQDLRKSWTTFCEASPCLAICFPQKTQEKMASSSCCIASAVRFVGTFQRQHLNRCGCTQVQPHSMQEPVKKLLGLSSGPQLLTSPLKSLELNDRSECQRTTRRCKQWQQRKINTTSTANTPNLTMAAPSVLLLLHTSRSSRIHTQQEA